MHLYIDSQCVLGGVVTVRVGRGVRVGSGVKEVRGVRVRVGRGVRGGLSP